MTASVKLGKPQAEHMSSGMPPITDVTGNAANGHLGPILLKKSEHGLAPNFSAPLVRFSETDVRGRIVCTRVNAAASKLIYGGT